MWQSPGDQWRTTSALRQCQEELMQWRQEVGFEDVAPNFGHGFGD
jgi:hypothetical protein